MSQFWQGAARGLAGGGEAGVLSGDTAGVLSLASGEVHSGGVAGKLPRSAAGLQPSGPAAVLSCPGIACLVGACDAVMYRAVAAVMMPSVVQVDYDNSSSCMQ